MKGRINGKSNFGIRNVGATLSVVAFSAIFVVVGCTSAHTKDELNASSEVPSTVSKAAAQTQWSAGMRGMASTLVQLMPYAFSRAEFGDSQNHGKLKKLIRDFAKGVDAVPQHAGEKLLGKDPIVQFAIQRLKSNTHEAEAAFNEGHIEFARNVLRDNMGLCFSCHSTSQFGPQNNFSHVTLSPTFRIYPSERADFYVATRQFDKAVDLLEGVLKTPGNLMDDPHEQLDALRKYLALEVRVKKDPARAASLLEHFLAQKNLPYFIAADGETWLKSLREWQNESPTDSEPTLFARAERLMKKARTIQAGDGYQAGYVDFLQASSLLHECLRSTKDTKQKARIYQLLGQSYDTLAETGIWDLPEFYFEACVRTAPKTPIAKSCYRDFERSMILGFSGSAGIFVPKEERDRMNELRKMAGF